MHNPASLISISTWRLYHQVFDLSDTVASFRCRARATRFLKRGFPKRKLVILSCAHRLTKRQRYTRYPGRSIMNLSIKFQSRFQLKKKPWVCSDGIFTVKLKPSRHKRVAYRRPFNKFYPILEIILILKSSSEFGAFLFVLFDPRRGPCEGSMLNWWREVWSRTLRV